MFKKHSTTTKKHTVSQEVKDERRTTAKKTVEDATNKLIEELQAGKTERLQSIFRFSALFHRYSYANMRLIEAHGRERDEAASYVASFNRWGEIGNEKHQKPYLVKKGEKAIWIWAPRPYTQKVINKETNKEEERDGLGFVLVPVFADYQIDQSEGQPPLESFFTARAESEDSQRLYSTLVSVAKNNGFTVREQEMNGGMQGYCANKLIVMKGNQDSTSKFLVLVHEYTHGLLEHSKHHAELSKQERELEAEATSFVVGEHFGIHNDFSSDYLLMYGNTSATLIAQLERIRMVAHTIIEQLEKALGTVQSEELVAA